MIGLVREVMNKTNLVLFVITYLVLTLKVSDLLATENHHFSEQWSGLHCTLIQKDGTQEYYIKWSDSKLKENLRHRMSNKLQVNGQASLDNDEITNYINTTYTLLFIASEFVPNSESNNAQRNWMRCSDGEPKYKFVTMDSCQNDWQYQSSSARIKNNGAFLDFVEVTLARIYPSHWGYSPIVMKRTTGVDGYYSFYNDSIQCRFKEISSINERIKTVESTFLSEQKVAYEKAKMGMEEVRKIVKKRLIENICGGDDNPTQCP